MEHIAIAMQDGGAGAGARHEAAARAARPTSFLSCHRTSGNPGGSPDRARKALNAETIAELHKAFRRGGAKAIDKVMKNNPAVFLKLLVLLVPREMQVEQSGGVKAMTDEQLERSLALIEEMLAQREAGANAKVIEGEAVPNLPPPVSAKNS